MPRCCRRNTPRARRRPWTNCVCVPFADTTEIGIDTPWLIFASLLFSTVIFGAEMMRIVPVSSRADNRRLMLKLPPTEPNQHRAANVGRTALERGPQRRNVGVRFQRQQRIQRRFPDFFIGIV